jgi:hypothetical protein
VKKKYTTEHKNVLTVFLRKGTNNLIMYTSYILHELISVLSSDKYKKSINAFEVHKFTLLSAFQRQGLPLCYWFFLSNVDFAEGTASSDTHDWFICNTTCNQTYKCLWFGHGYTTIRGPICICTLEIVIAQTLTRIEIDTKLALLRSDS